VQTQTTALKQRHQAWVEAVNSGDLAGWVAIVTEDIVWIPPGQTVIEGRAALVEWLRPFLEDYEYEYATTGQAVRLVGERALERSAYVSRLRSRRGGEELEHVGSYVALWRWEEGRWSGSLS
jgi:uncharacterized protein (TIGR02246 family)